MSSNNVLPLSTGKFYIKNNKKNNGSNNNTRTKVPSNKINNRKTNSNFSNSTKEVTEDKLTNNTRTKVPSNKINNRKTNSNFSNSTKEVTEDKLTNNTRTKVPSNKIINRKTIIKFSNSTKEEVTEDKSTNNTRTKVPSNKKNNILSPNKIINRKKNSNFSNSTKEEVTEDKSTNSNSKFKLNENYNLNTILKRKPFGKIFRDSKGNIFMYSRNYNNNNIATFKEIVQRNGDYEVKNYQKKDKKYYQINYHNNGNIKFNTPIYKFDDPTYNNNKTKIYTYLGTLNNLKRKYPNGIFKIYNPYKSTGKHKPPKQAKQANTLLSKVTGYFTGKKK